MYRVPTELVDLLAGLYDDNQTVRYVLERAGIPTGYIAFAGGTKVVWHNAIKEALKHERLPALLDVASADYPSFNWINVAHAVASASPEQPSRLSPLDGSRWRGPTSERELEKLTGCQPTFLPVHFFELGLVTARSVALIRLPGASGTGFLTTGNLLLTNNHVISTIEEARSARITFNFQDMLNGSRAPETGFELAPDDAFATSREYDWTAVKVRGDANAAWGAIALGTSTVKKGDFVNIIQHPMGGPKVVALYHNVVAYEDGDCIQYLTDTLPGSSGSPVFDSNWSLVAIHHASQSLKTEVRNEGIPVGRVVEGLRQAGLI
ncbi:MAG TPA: trypsin-like peptidase domain-containing protein [Pirellulales bacterium]|nr:trypsin-like peptidase domain-containing protein [Pirellulales bacterium]